MPGPLQAWSLPVPLPAPVRGALWALLVWTAPGPAHVPWLIATALVANLGQFAMTNAYRAADATAVFPFDFARLPFTALIASFAFAQRPDAWTRIGAAVIFGSTVYVGRRESRLGRRSAAFRAGN